MITVVWSSLITLVTLGRGMGWDVDDPNRIMMKGLWVNWEGKMEG